MRTALHHVPVVIVIAVMAGSLGGCGTISGWIAVGFEDYVPVWAGGPPANVPPRPGTAKYDEWMKERERQRLETAAKKDDTGKPDQASIDPIH
jgi:hypothetical protein